jgi:hypothetical protein
VRHGVVSVERARRRIAEARERIRRVRDLVARSGGRAARLPLAEICAETLARGAGRDPQAGRARGELAAAAAGLAAWLRKTFLAGATPAHAAGRRRPG